MASFSEFFRRSLPLLFLFWSGATASEPRVYRDSVTPHWFANQTRFWYRNDLQDGAREFVLVDAERGKRQPAFDHAHTAAELSKLLSREVTAEKLPVERLEFEDSAQAVVLSGRDQAWRLDLNTYELHPCPDAAAAVESLPASRKKQPGFSEKAELLRDHSAGCFVFPASCLVAAWAARPAAIRAVGLGAGFVHRHGAARNALQVQPTDGFLGFRVIRHFDEAEAPRSAGLAVGYHVHARYFAELAEFLADILLGRLKREISHVDIHAEPYLHSKQRKKSNWEVSNRRPTTNQGLAGAM